MNTTVPFTFAAVAQLVAGHGWRPFPGAQTSKTPVMPGWSGLNNYEWDITDLIAAIDDFQPVDDFCCCLAVQREIVVIDADIIDPEHAAYASKLADEILGETPLLRIGQAPKCIRVYRAGDLIKSRRPPSRFSAVWSVHRLRLACKGWSPVYLATGIPAHSQCR